MDAKAAKPTGGGGGGGSGGGWSTDKKQEAPSGAAAPAPSAAPDVAARMGGKVVESADVVRVMLQYCKENGLEETMRALQAESGVHLNTVDSLETFSSDIAAGRWDSVLAQVASLELPPEKLFALYEQIVKELVELHELPLAHDMLRKTRALADLRAEHPRRCSPTHSRPRARSLTLLPPGTTGCSTWCARAPSTARRRTPTAGRRRRPARSWPSC